jgi:hypothetical protein
MFDARVALVDIANKVQNTYNTNERWVVRRRNQSMPIKLLLFCPLFTIKIRCNIFAINLP